MIFPPKKIQFWLLLGGLWFGAFFVNRTALRLLSKYPDDRGIRLPEVYKLVVEFPIKVVFKFQTSFFDNYGDFIIFIHDHFILVAISIILFYTLTVWFIGSIIWMFANAIKNRKENKI